MPIKLDVTASGRYIVSVNGVDLEGQHDHAREAFQRCANLALANPEDVVEYRSAQRVRVRVTVTPDAPVPVPVPSPVPAPGADVLWEWDATTVAPFGIHAREPHSDRVTLVYAGGRPAVRLLTLPGDNNVNGSGTAERCDLRLSNDLSDAKEGREWWFKHSVWFPNDFVDQPESALVIPPGLWHWGSVMSWHDDADTGGSQGPLQLQMMPRTATSADRPTGLHFEIFGGIGGLKRGEFPVAPIVRNKWNDFIYHIGWTSTSTGFADGWLDGRQFMAHKGPTLHAGHGAYLKLANYHTAHGMASAVLHGRAVRARTREALG